MPTEQTLDSFLDDFEAQGAVIANPVLDEGNYKGHLVAITTRNGITPNKKTQENQAWASWGFSIDLESVSASEKMKRDGDVRVFADRDCVQIGNNGQYLNLFPFGIAKEGNAAFWSFVGSLLSVAELAEKVKDDSGAETYNIDKNIIRGIYQGTEAEKARLEETSDLDKLLVPAKLAEFQLKQLTELLTAEQNTSQVYVHIARGSNYNDKSKMRHFVKNIMLAPDFEADQSKMDSLVL